MVLLMFTTGLAHAQESCAGKEANIRRQLDHARDNGNAGQIRGLETALDKVRTHCTNEGLQAERQDDIDEVREEISEREADLREALEDGEPQKVERRERKLDESREELRQLLEK